MRFKPFVIFGVLSLAAACASTPEPGPAPKASTAPAPPVYILADILGASAGAIDEMFGAPALTRKEGAGEYRRYALTTCSLIIILYPDELGAAKVAHVDATATHSAGGKPDLGACLAAG